MDAPQTDIDLETKARAQAESILQAQAEQLSEVPAVAAFFTAVTNALGVAKPPAPKVTQVPKPGRELLLWHMRGQPDLQSAAALAYTLLEHPAFVATVPPDRECPILTYQVRRKWNDAAQQWAAVRDAKARTSLECDRRLVLRRRGGKVELCCARKDLDISFDPKTQQLVPVRIEGCEPIHHANFAQVTALFPNLTVRLLADGLLAPTQFLPRAGRSAASPDAYVATAPLFVSNMEVYMTDKKKKKDDKDDPNKGFVTWLSNTLKQSGAK